MKTGALTIGQPPRDDALCDLKPVFGGKVELSRRGTLDGLSPENIRRFAPEAGDYVPVSKLLDGSEVVFAEKHILPRLQRAIGELETDGVELIAFSARTVSRFRHLPPCRCPIPVTFRVALSLC